MSNRPLTADERERRIVEYLKTRNRGEIAEYQLTRMNRVANFRKQLMTLVEEFIEARAEIIAAGMLMDSAPKRPASQLKAIRKARPLRRRKSKMPVWLGKTANSINS